MTFDIFDETYYLNNNPDVKAAVANGSLGSGLQHFQQYGIREGRTNVSPNWNEQLYLQFNPDVAANTGSGRFFSSGLQHFIQFGEREGRRGAPVLENTGGFDEDYYLSLYPDVASAIASGQFDSAVSHYNRRGLFEGRFALYSGTNDDDILIGSGSTGGLVGVGIDTISRPGSPDPVPTSLGMGEVDVLIGSAGSENFPLGFARSPANPNPQKFYVGGGNGDYAYIQNFNRNSDTVQLAGSPGEYDVFFEPALPVGNSNRQGVSIFTNGDLIGIVEGIESLQVISQDTEAGNFFLG